VRRGFAIFTTLPPSHRALPIRNWYFSEIGPNLAHDVHAAIVGFQSLAATRCGRGDAIQPREEPRAGDPGSSILAISVGEAIGGGRKKMRRNYSYVVLGRHFVLRYNIQVKET
jgi:hypothetical protein